MRPTRLAALAALASALALAPAPRLATQENAAAAAPSAPAQAPAAAPAEQTLRRSVLPGEAQPAPPRTMRAYWHVFAAFTLAWLLLFGYAVSLGRRFRNLEREVDALRGTS